MTLNRPDKFNALTEAVGEEFRAHVADLAAMPPRSLRSLVLTGAGPAFSAGYHALRALWQQQQPTRSGLGRRLTCPRSCASPEATWTSSGRAPRPRPRTTPRSCSSSTNGSTLSSSPLTRVMAPVSRPDVGVLWSWPTGSSPFAVCLCPSLRQSTCVALLQWWWWCRGPRPTLTLVWPRGQGPAVGAGFCLAMSSDLRIAAKDAKLSANFVKLGLHPGKAHTQTLFPSLFVLVVPPHSPHRHSAEAGLGATHYMPRSLGPQVANRLLFVRTCFHHWRGTTVNHRFDRPVRR